MGGRTCKTSHLGKNTLKNRRFLESNNADSGEHVQGLPKSGVWSFGLDAEEVLSPGAGWTLPLSTGPLRPQALPSAPCPFWKSEGSHSIHAFTFGELASALGRARACLLLPALSLATSYLNLVLVQAMPPLRGPPSSLLSARWLLPPRLSSSTISSSSFSSPPSLTVPHTAPSCPPCSQIAMPLCK